MGFKLRVPLGNGVKLNINRKSVSVSAGTKGVRASVNSKGYVSTSVGNENVSYTKTYKVGKKKSLFELIVELFKRK